MTLKTLADLRDAYQATLPSGQRRADVRATLTQLGHAVAPEKTLEQIPLATLRRPARSLACYLQARIEQQTLQPGSARQHRARLSGVLAWLQQAYPEVANRLQGLDAEEEALIGRVITLPGATNAGSSLRALFQALAREGRQIAELATQGPRLMEELVARIQPQSSWKGRYTALCRALLYLQDEGAIPDFDIPYQPHQDGRTPIPSWRTWPEGILKEKVEEYVRKACDESLTARQWPHAPIEESTRDKCLFAVEHYVHLSMLQGVVEVFELTPQEVFSRSYMAAYIHFCREACDGIATTGLAGRFDDLGRLTRVLWELPAATFHGLLDARQVKPWKDKAARMTTCDEHLQLIRFIEQQARQARTRPNRLSLERLSVLLFFNLCIPVRADNLLPVRLGRHLITDTPSGRWEVRFTAKEVKGRRPLTYEVAVSLQRRLEHYLATTRKQVLQGGDSDYLFPTGRGHAVLGNQINRELKDRDQQWRQVKRKDTKNLHLVRDIVTLTCTRKMKNGLREASRLLGHKNPDITRDNYFGQYGRQLLLEEWRDLGRKVKEPRITPEQARLLMEVLQQDPDEFRRFRKALDDLPPGGPPCV